MTTPPVREMHADLLERFCLEYVKDFKGGPAARRAGVAVMSARHWASRALARPDVAARVATLKAAQLQRVGLEVDDLVDRLARIATVDVSELVEFRRCCCRHCWGKGHRHQFTQGELSAARARHGKAMKKAQTEGRDLVDEIEPFDEEGGGGYNATNDPNPECPECFGEGHGMPFLKDTREFGPNAAAAFAGMKVTKEGVEVKTHDPVKAIELLGRHLNMFTDKLDLNVTVHQLARRMRNRTPLA